MRLFTIFFVLFCCEFCNNAHALTPKEIRQRAVFMVVSLAGRDTAVCIHSSGVFITSARSVANQTKVRLLSPWLPDGKNAFDMLVWRVDSARDLAVLVPEKPVSFPFASIAPGDADNLDVKARVTFFGFAIENKTMPGNPAMPQVEIANAHVISLPNQDDKVPLIRVLAASPLMKAGGPLVDENGRLVGIMRKVQKLGANPSTALSINDILTVLMPKITVRTAPTNFRKSGTAQQVFVSMETAEEQAEPESMFRELDKRLVYTMDIAFGDGKAWRSCTVGRVNTGEFDATDIRGADEQQSLLYKISVRRNGLFIGTVTGTLNLTTPKMVLPPAELGITSSATTPLVPVPLLPETANISQR